MEKQKRKKGKDDNEKAGGANGNFSLKLGLRLIPLLASCDTAAEDGAEGEVDDNDAAGLLC